MRNADSRRSRTVKRYLAVTMLSLAILGVGPSPTVVQANAFDQLVKLYGCVVTWGIVCDLSVTVIGTGPVSQPIPVTCTPPLLNGLPQFLSWPKGSAKYRFQSICSSPARPNAVMTVRWEGSWTPSETKEDRPNASETLEIMGFEPFLPDRAPGGTLFMYWTARCTRDPWLQSGSCTPWGAYVPDDLREALPDIDRQSFARTGNVIAPADKRRLYAEYLRINPPSYFSKLGLVEGQSASSRQRKYFAAPPIAVDKPKAPTEQSPAQGSARSRLEELGQQQDIPSVPYAPGVAIQQKPSNSSIFSRGLASDDGDSKETETAEAPLSVTIDRPLYVRSMGGEDVALETGVYEVESVMDLQLSLAKEGQPSILLPAVKSTHNESLNHSAVVLVSSESDLRHLILLRPDGLRLDVTGSTSGIHSRGSGNLIALPQSKVREAMFETSAAPSTGAGGPPPCVQNPLPTGPRWIPPGCQMPSIPLPNIPGSVPDPYLDGTNQLYACVNNFTGVFRIIRAVETCAAGNNEVKVKWQLVP